MQYKLRQSMNALGATVLFATGLFGPRCGFSQEQASKYREHGKIVATGTTGHTEAEVTVYSHTYKVETDKAILELDCGKTPTFGLIKNGKVGPECGGDKKLQIGDEIEFWIDKDAVYVSVTKGKNKREEKLRIMSRELKREPDKSKSAQ